MLCRKRPGSILRPTAVLLTAALLAGCATQKVSFTSIPPGAMVTVGDKQGITPCTLRVSKEEGPAVFRLSSGEERVIPIHGMDSHFDETTEASGKVLGGTLMAVGGSVFIVGGVVFFGVLILDDDDEDSYSDPASEEDDDSYELLGYSLLTMVSGGAVFVLGKWIYPEEAEAVLHVDFHNVENVEPEKDPRYEDQGYGARRLKKAVP